MYYGYMNELEKLEKRRAYDREWKRKKYRENPIKARAKARLGYKKMRSIHERVEKYRAYHRAYDKEWRKNNPQYLISHREQMRSWYKKNSHVIYVRRRQKPYEKLATTIRTRIRQLLKLGYKSESTEKLLGITAKELKIYLEERFKQGMSWDNYGFRGWHVDHIRPLSSFDLTKKEEQKQAFHYTNLQPLWAKENMQKGAKMV